jgi:hypothetical protein
VPRNASDIDRLIEEGLTRYGSGDVDGALSVWEQVLLTDPGNAQANSYVEYVRTNYAVLTTDPEADEGTTIYGGIGDDPEYHIEISPGQLASGEPAPLYMDPSDQGWFLDEESNRVPSNQDESGALTLDLEAPSPDEEPRALELDADEPASLELDADEPRAFELEADEPPDPLGDSTKTYPKGSPPPDLDFGDTNAYPKAAAAPELDFSDTATGEFRNEDLTPGFGPEATPVGFSTQVTDVKKPKLGFVQPRNEPPELKVTVRTPAQDAKSAKAAEVKPPAPEKDPMTLRKPFEDLIESLPSPRPAGPSTRDLPDERRPPAAAPPGDTLKTPVATRTPAPPIGSADTMPGAAAKPPLGSADTMRPAGQTRPPASTRPTKPQDIVETTRTKPPSKPAPSQPITRPPPNETRPPASVAPSRQPHEDVARAPTRQSVPSPGRTPDVAIGIAPTREFSGTPTQKLPVPPAPADNGGEGLPSLTVPTRDLGLRPGGRAQSPPMEEEPTKESNIRQLRDEAARGRAEPAGTKSDLGVVSFDPIDARSAQILQEVDAEASPDENKEDRTRRRISSLIDRALGWNGISDYDKAVAAIDLALSEDPNSALAQKMIHRNRDTIMTVFQNYIGDLQRTPILAKPLHELSKAPISPRAAFLLSRIDGTLSIDELLDVSGMPRLEAYRYLCQLFLRGILR